MSSYKILVAEDSIDVSRMLKRVVVMTGADRLISWTFCASLEELEKLQASLKPDLILSDISFPDGESHDLLSRLFSNEKAYRPMLIAYTSYEFGQIPDTAMFDGYISKDTDPMDVINKCISLVQGRDSRGTE